MKVRILKCQNDSWWYSKKIGHEFEVIDYNYSTTDCKVKTPGGEYDYWFISKEDCEIVEESAATPVDKNGKILNMTLETAREMYKDSTKMTKKWLLENFTIEELEEKKGFTWEDSFDGGWQIVQHNKCEPVVSYFPNRNDKQWDSFKTREQAESALAFAQLSHIVAKYNEGKKPLNMGPLNLPTYFFIFPTSSGKLEYAKYMNESEDGPDSIMLKFNRREDAETSLEVNRELWEKYWMIK